MGRRFITAHDIDDLAAAGSRELRLEAGARLTDLARELARDRGIAIVEVGAASVGADTRAAPPSPAPAPAPAAAPSAHDDDGTPRRQLRAAVRAGVVEEFGGTPEGLDAAIGRVFDRLGIRD